MDGTSIAAVAPGVAAGLITIGSLVWLDRRNALHRSIVCVVAIALMWRYMLWRIFGSLPPSGFTLDFAVGLIFVAVELLSMFSTTMSLFFLTRIATGRPTSRPICPGWRPSRPRWSTC